MRGSNCSTHTKRNDGVPPLRHSTKVTRPATKRWGRYAICRAELPGAAYFHALGAIVPACGLGIELNVHFTPDSWLSFKASVGPLRAKTGSSPAGVARRIEAIPSGDAPGCRTARIFYGRAAIFPRGSSDRHATSRQGGWIHRKIARHYVARTLVAARVATFCLDRR